MPHLDITTYFSQIFWLIASFLVLYTIFAKLFFPSIAKVVDARTSKVDSDLKSAESLMNEYKEKQNKIKGIVDDARLKAIEVSERASLKYSANFESQISSLEEKLKKDFAKEEEKLFRMKSSLEDKVDEVSAEVEAAITEKLYNSYR